MREPRTESVVQREKQAVQDIVESGEPYIALYNLSFAGGVTIEYPEGHSVLIQACNFENEDEPVVIRQMSKVSQDDLIATTRSLQEIEDDLKGK